RDFGERDRFSEKRLKCSELFGIIGLYDSSKSSKKQLRMLESKLPVTPSYVPKRICLPGKKDAPLLGAPGDQFVYRGNTVEYSFPAPVSPSIARCYRKRFVNPESCRGEKEYPVTGGLTKCEYRNVDIWGTVRGDRPIDERNDEFRVRNPVPGTRVF